MNGIALAAVLLIAPVSTGPDLQPLPRPRLEAMGPAVKVELDAAWSRLEKLLAQPDTPPTELADAFGEVGLLARAYRLDTSAATALGNAALLDPEAARWPYLVGVVAQEGRRLAEAADAFEDALALRPGFRQAVQRRADVARLLGQREEAMRRYEALLEEPAFAASAHWGLGRLQEGSAPEAARAHLERALELAPEASAIHRALGSVLLRLGEATRAREHLARAGNVGVSFPDPLVDAVLAEGGGAWTLRGRLALRRGQPGEAVEHFRRALEADPSSASAHRELAIALERLDLRTESRDAYLEVTRLTPDLPRAWFELARAQLRAGAPSTDAAESLRRALDLAPDYPEARALLVPIELELAQRAQASGDLEEAARAFDRALALALDQDLAEVHFDRALLAARAGDLARAARHFTEVVRLRPEDREARRLGARAFFEAGERDQAVALQTDLLARARRSGAPPEVLARLEADLQRYREVP